MAKRGSPSSISNRLLDLECIKKQTSTLCEMDILRIFWNNLNRPLHQLTENERLAYYRLLGASRLPELPEFAAVEASANDQLSQKLFRLVACGLSDSSEWRPWDGDRNLRKGGDAIRGFRWPGPGSVAVHYKPFRYVWDDHTTDARFFYLFQPTELYYPYRLNLIGQWGSSAELVGDVPAGLEIKWGTELQPLLEAKEQHRNRFEHVLQQLKFTF